MVFIVFGIFVVCGIVGTVYFNKMVNILQEENVPTTFADRCFFPFNLRNKFIHFVHTCPDREKQAEYMKEREGAYPSWYADDLQIDYRYDMTAFFLAFPFINVTEFAKSLDINPSLMRKYKSGLAKAGEKQKDMIQRKFDDILGRLSAVRF